MRLHTRLLLVATSTLLAADVSAQPHGAADASALIAVDATIQRPSATDKMRSMPTSGWALEDDTKVKIKHTPIRALRKGVEPMSISAFVTGYSRPALPPSHAEAIGWIETRNCTAFHVGKGVVVTAGHCFPGVQQLSINTPCNYEVRWGVQQTKTGGGNWAQSGTSRCTHIRAAVADQFEDWAVFTVAPIPRSKLAVAPNSTATGAPLQIIGHAKGPPLYYSEGGCTGRSAADTRLDYLRDRDWIVAYKCSTEKGSSGSPVFRTDSWEVVGVHNYGVTTNESTGDGINWATAVTHATFRAALNL